MIVGLVKSAITKSTDTRLSDSAVLAEAEAILSNPDAFLPVETAVVA